MTTAWLVFYLALTTPAKRWEKCYDKIAITFPSNLQKERCKGKAKRCQACRDIEKNIVKHLTAFYNHNNALCPNPYAKYGL